MDGMSEACNKYRLKIPGRAIEARQVHTLDYDGMCDIVGWCGGRAIDHGESVIEIQRDDGSLRQAGCGDWVIKCVTGFDIVDDYTFRRLYEASGDGETVRAERLRDQVMKTWEPPLLAGDERPADIAQTSTMIAIAYIMGREFMPAELTENQRAAIDGGVRLMNRELGGE